MKTKSALCKRIQSASVLAPLLFVLILHATAGEAHAQQQQCVPVGTTLSAGSQLCLPVIDASNFFSSCGFLNAGGKVRWEVFWGATAAEAASQANAIAQPKATSTIINFDYINNASLFSGFFMACVHNPSTSGGSVTFGFWCEQDFRCTSG